MTAPFFKAADNDGDGFVTFAEAEAHARQSAAPARNPTAGMEGDGAGPMTSRVKPVAIPETESPIQTLDAKAADGRAVRAFWRGPKGDGPFAAVDPWPVEPAARRRQAGCIGCRSTVLSRSGAVRRGSPR